MNRLRRVLPFVGVGVATTLFLVAVGHAATLPVVLFPGVASLQGVDGTQWRSEVILSNPDALGVSVLLEIIPRGTSAPSASKSLTLAAGLTLRIADVYAELQAGSGSGVLRVTGEALAWVRTYNIGGQGTFGQEMPPVSGEGYPAGQQVFFPVTNPADIAVDVRSNLLVYNLETYTVQLVLTTGNVNKTLTVPANAYAQFNNLGKFLGGPVGLGVVGVSGDGRWTGTMATIDPVTGDPTTVEGITFTVPPPLAVTAKGEPATGTGALAVTFTASVTGGTSPYSFDWDFGDGTSHASAPSPLHTYTQVGAFNWSVTVLDSRRVTAIATGTVTVSSPPLSVTCSAVPTSGTAPLTVAFSATPSGGTGLYAFDWGFGDGSAHSTQANPSHQYTQSGTFTATVTVTSGVQTATCNKQVTVTSSAPCGLAITTQPQSVTVNVGGTATLTVVASGPPPLSYQWYLGSSGDISTPIGGAAESSYTTPPLSGTTSYWVRVISSCGSVDSATAVVTVAAGNHAPVLADFSPAPPMIMVANSSRYLWFSVSDADGDTVRVTATVSSQKGMVVAPSALSVVETGMVTIRISAGLAENAVITLSADDGNGGITVQPYPVIVK